MKLSEKMKLDSENGLTIQNLKEYIERAKSLEKSNENLTLALKGDASVVSAIDSNPRVDTCNIKHEMGQ